MIDICEQIEMYNLFLVTILFVKTSPFIPITIPLRCSKQDLNVLRFLVLVFKNAVLDNKYAYFMSYS